MDSGDGIRECCCSNSEQKTCVAFTEKIINTGDLPDIVASESIPKYLLNKISDISRTLNDVSPACGTSYLVDQHGNKSTNCYRCLTQRMYECIGELMHIMANMSKDLARSKSNEETLMSSVSQCLISSLKSATFLLERLKALIDVQKMQQPHSNIDNSSEALENVLNILNLPTPESSRTNIEKPSSEEPSSNSNICGQSTKELSQSSCSNCDSVSGSTKCRRCNLCCHCSCTGAQSTEDDNSEMNSTEQKEFNRTEQKKRKHKCRSDDIPDLRCKMKAKIIFSQKTKKSDYNSPIKEMIAVLSSLFADMKANPSMSSNNTFTTKSTEPNVSSPTQNHNSDSRTSYDKIQMEKLHSDKMCPGEDNTLPVFIDSGIQKASLNEVRVDHDQPTNSETNCDHQVKRSSSETPPSGGCTQDLRKVISDAGLAEPLHALYQLMDERISHNVAALVNIESRKNSSSLNTGMFQNPSMSSKNDKNPRTPRKPDQQESFDFKSRIIGTAKGRKSLSESNLMIEDFAIVPYAKCQAIVGRK